MLDHVLLIYTALYATVRVHNTESWGIVKLRDLLRPEKWLTYRLRRIWILIITKKIIFNIFPKFGGVG